jgi:hypothetical protein
MQVKYVALSGAVVLLAASSTWAAIGQAQGFSVGGINTVPWGGGVGSVDARHSVTINQEQRAATHHLRTTAVQTGTGVFTQTASANGTGPSHTGQTATIQGAQHQMAMGPAQAQRQHLGANFTTQIGMPWGSGTATATQSFVGGQTNSLLTPTSTHSETQALAVTQYTAVVGGPHGAPTVSNSLNVNLTQGQLGGTSTAWPCVR